jgi:hypothetical protein
MVKHLLVLCCGHDVGSIKRSWSKLTDRTMQQHTKRKESPEFS